MGLYRDFETRPPTIGVSPPDGLSPPWLQKPAGQAWLGAHGDLKDWLAGSAKEAVKARCPDLAPVDALAQLGPERQILRGSTETDDAYRLRILAAWDLWRLGGTPLGLLRALLVAGYDTATIVTQTGNHHTLDGGANLVTSHTNDVHLGGAPAELWSDFGIYIVSASFFDGLAVMLPFSLSFDETTKFLDILAIIRTWKPAHARCVNVAISSSAVNVWGQTGLAWGGGGLTWQSGGDYFSYVPTEW